MRSRVIAALAFVVLAAACSETERVVEPSPSTGASADPCALAPDQRLQPDAAYSRAVLAMSDAVDACGDIVSVGEPIRTSDGVRLPTEVRNTSSRRADFSSQARVYLADGTDKFMLGSMNRIEAGASTPVAASIRLAPDDVVVRVEVMRVLRSPSQT